jgi:hypothetical protein
MAMSARDIRRRFDGDWYVAYHAPRYAKLLTILTTLSVTPQDRVLDIGRSHLTTLIHETLHTTVDTLGFAPDEDLDGARHYQFDLNRAQLPEQWRTDLPQYRLVVMAEVIEHLYTAPSLVLRFIRSLVADGGFLVVQTPNAAMLSRRLKLLAGSNPYMLISENVSDPQHFREYTRQELTAYAEKAGFDVKEVQMLSYFDLRFEEWGRPRTARRLAGASENFAYSLLPRSLRTGMTFVLKARQPRSG